MIIPIQFGNSGAVRKADIFFWKWQDVVDVRRGVGCVCGSYNRYYNLGIVAPLGRQTFFFWAWQDFVDVRRGVGCVCGSYNRYPQRNRQPWRSIYCTWLFLDSREGGRGLVLQDQLFVQMVTVYHSSTKFRLLANDRPTRSFFFLAGAQTVSQPPSLFAPAAALRWRDLQVMLASLRGIGHNTV
jgi:hypothetical protein